MRLSNRGIPTPLADIAQMGCSFGHDCGPVTHLATIPHAWFLACAEHLADCWEALGYKPSQLTGPR